MSIIAKASGDGGNFEPAPAGTYRAVCVDVVDLGVLDVSWQGQTKRQHKINVAWVIDEEREDGKPFMVFKRYTLSLSEKASLRKDLESWRGRKFTREEEMGFDVETVVGKSCVLGVAHAEKSGTTYANVTSISPLMKGMQAMPVPADYIRKKDRTDAQPPAHDEPPMEPITADDIPFAWVLPLLSLLGAGIVYA